jgi:hypothetical protein
MCNFCITPSIFTLVGAIMQAALSRLAVLSDTPDLPGATSPRSQLALKTAQPLPLRHHRDTNALPAGSVQAQHKCDSFPFCRRIVSHPQNDIFTHPILAPAGKPHRFCTSAKSLWCIATPP